MELPLSGFPRNHVNISIYLYTMNYTLSLT